jgi:hypothetical protein
MSKGVVVLTGLLLLAAGGVLFGDVIEPDYHPVSRCVTVGNLDEYPDIVVAAVYNGPTTEGNEIYLVKSDSCLQKGYKFNTLGLFWVLKSYADEVGVDGLPVDQMADMMVPVPAKKRQEDVAADPMWGLITVDIEPYGGTVPDENPLVSEESIYHINRGSGTFGFTLDKVKRVSHYRDGTEDVVDFIQTPVAQSRENRLAPIRLSVNAALGNGYLLVTPNMSGRISGVLLDCTGRVVSRFTRNGKGGNTYLVPASAGSGIYWLQVHGAGKHTTLRINSFR